MSSRAVFLTLFATVFALACTSTAYAAENEPAPPRKPHGISLTQAGLVTFLAGYAWSAGTGLVYRDRDHQMAPLMFVPVVGPIVADRRGRIESEYMLAGRAIDATHANQCGDAAVCGKALLFLPLFLVEYAMLYGAPLAQATGLLVALVGAGKESDGDAARATSSSRPKLSVMPTVGAGTVGVSLSATQW